MSAAEKIAAARALIEPLTGHTPGPWQVDAPEDESVEIAARIFAIAGLYETAPEALPDARLIAAAPALRDTVAALADLADALAQENARLKATLEWYASDEAWTMRQLESGHGDYGKRAREALRATP